MADASSTRRPEPVCFFRSILDTTFFSSGDLIADRRFSYAQMLAESGDFAAAADLVTQALERVPGFVPGLELLGRFAEAAGDMPTAFGAWRQMLATDPEDRFGAELKLAAHGAVIRRAVPALAYVETLFNAYASDFDAALAQRLAYRVPQLIETMLVDMNGNDATTTVTRALDLGCGTGLMGERLRRHCSFLEGVDLSDAMIGQAVAKCIYDRVEQGELLAWLARCGTGADLVTAADVFAYLGDLKDVFVAVAKVLRPGGLFLFSVEALDGTEPCVLRSSLRYAHSETGLRDGLAMAGFDVARLDRAEIRMDQGAPIVGFIVGARRRGLPIMTEDQALPAEAAVETPKVN